MQSTLSSKDKTVTNDSFKTEIIAGFFTSPKRITSKFFYDELGSSLFEKITTLPEYYLTRTEISIFERFLPEMAAAIGPKATVVEFGSGSGTKTRMLLGHLLHPRSYIPIDISRETLHRSAMELSIQFPQIEICPIHADYTEEIRLPGLRAADGRTLIFFPGSTIGNFTPPEAESFLRRAASLVGPRGALLIGFDRRKDPRILEAAYNDSEGVTAAFNLNLIRRIDDAFGIHIPAENFKHYAFFNEAKSRIEMHLVSLEDQRFSLDGNEIFFSKDEHVVTEYSYKYTSESFQMLLKAGGFEVERRWTDPKDYFEVCYATLAD